MATVYGVNKTKAKDPTPSNILNPGLLGGTVRVMQDTYEAAALAAGSIIEVCKKLPKGAIIIDALLHTDNLSNNTTLQLGDYEDDDRYIDATDHGAGAELVTRMGIGNIDGRSYEMDDTTPGATTSDRQLIITTAAGEATGTIKVVVLYTHE